MRQFGPCVSRFTGMGVVVIGCLLLANCTTGHKSASRIDPRYGVAASPRVIPPGQPIPKGGGTYLVGKPYVVAGRTYYPAENKRYRREGIASWYGEDFHGRLTANGEIYDMNAISAAHPTLPIPSYARVTNLHNGRSLIVRVNDRGPFHDDREIDLSSKAAELLGVRNRGVARVRVEYVGPAALEGSDDRKLMATLREGAPAPAPSKVMVASAEPYVSPAAAPGGRRPAAEAPPARRASPPPERAASEDDEPTRATAERRPAGVVAEPLPPARKVAEARAVAAAPAPPAQRAAPVAAEPLPAPRRVADAGPSAGERGTPDHPRLVWQVGPAPARIAPAGSHAPADAGHGIATGRGLY
ncbi:MAG: septal ring lytic transglycosylase RlpA family protein [Variibacter sp.]|nr:septal ring lytic transglycosylase RlpA family protein [Variibacter sp.]